jgi:hypothetical protein
VQLIDWNGDTLVKQASLPVAGHPRRALVNQGELIAVSDSNVTVFDLGRRDVALKTADLVIGHCEVQPDFVQPTFGSEMGGEGGEPMACGGLFFCSSSSGVSGRGGFWAGALLGLVAVGGALRRRAK